MQIFLLSPSDFTWVFGGPSQPVFHVRRHRVDRELQAVAVRIEEVDRLADAVVDRPEHVDAVGFDARLVSHQGFLVGHAQREMLDPERRVGVAAHRRRLGQLAERDVAAVVATW
jgi:hypothetical protein